MRNNGDAFANDYRHWWSLPRKPSGLSTVVSTPELLYEAEISPGALDSSRAPSLSPSTNEKTRKSVPSLLTAPFDLDALETRPESRKRDLPTVATTAVGPCPANQPQERTNTVFPSPSELLLGVSSHRLKLITDDQL